MPSWAKDLPQPFQALAVGVGSGLVGGVFVTVALVLVASLLPATAAAPIMGALRVAGSAVSILGPTIAAFYLFDSSATAAAAAAGGAFVTYYGTGLLVSLLVFALIVQAYRV